MVEKGLADDPVGLGMGIAVAIVLLHLLRTSLYAFATSRRRQRGFSLIEMLIVMSILTMLAGVALVNTVQASRIVDAQDALKQVVMVRDAEVTYTNCTVAQHPNCGQALSVVPSPSGSSTVKTMKYEFTFCYCGGDWTYKAAPIKGIGRSYYTDSSGLIRYSDSSQAGASSSVLQ